MSKRTILILVIVALVILAVVYRNQITAFFTGTRTLNGGAPPTVDDENCGNTLQRTGSGRIVRACTKPLYRKVGTARERAWVMETDDYPFDTCQGDTTTIKTQDGTKWWYNYQSDAKCIYISDNRFPFIS